MLDTISNLWQNDHDLAIILVNFLISLLMLIISNIYKNYKDSLKAIDNCKIKINNFKNSLINTISNNNKDLIQEQFINYFQNLENIHIIEKKNKELYVKFGRLQQIYENFLNGMYEENQEKIKIISEIENL